MKTLFKFIAISALVVVLLVAIAFAATFFLIDSNFIKTQLTARIQEKIGGTLTINDVKIYPLPIIRVAATDIVWKNSEKGVAADIERLAVRFPAYQLIGNGPINATVALINPSIQLTTPAAALSPAQWYNTTQPAATDTTAPVLTQNAPSSSPKSGSFQDRVRERLVVHRLIIEDGDFSSARTGQAKIAISDIALDVGPLALGATAEQRISIDFSADVKEGPVTGPIAAKGDIATTPTAGIVNLSGLSLSLWNATVTLDGTIENLHTIPKFTLTLDTQGLDPKTLQIPGLQEKLAGVEGPLTASLHLTGSGKDAQAIKASTSGDGKLSIAAFAIPEKQMRLDGITLTAAFGNGRIRLTPLHIDTLSLDSPKLALKNVVLNASIADEDDIAIDSLTTELLNGTLQVHGILGSLKTTPTFDIQANGNRLDLSLLPPSPTKKASDYKIGGIAQLNLSAKGSAPDPSKLKEGIHANGGFVINDMPLPEMDLSKQGSKRQLPPPLAARAEEQMAKIQPVIEKTLSVKKLDRFSGTVAYTNGNITLTDTVAVNPNFEVRLAGTINANRALNLDGNLFIAKARTDELIKTQSLAGGVAAGLAEPDGRMKIPFAVEGSSDKPQVKLDYGEIAQKLVKSAVETGAVREQIKQNIQQGGAPARETIQKGVEEIKKGGPKKVLENIFGR